MAMSLQLRIMTLAGVLTAALVGLGVVAWWGAGELILQADRATSRLQESALVTGVACRSYQQYQHFADLIIRLDLEEIKKFQATAQKFQKELLEMEGLTANDQERTWLKEARTANQNFHELVMNKVVPETEYLNEKKLSKGAAEAEGQMQIIQENGKKLSASFRNRLGVSIMASEYQSVVEQANQTDEVARLVQAGLRQYVAMARLVLTLDTDYLDTYFQSQEIWDQLMEKVSKAIQGDEESKLLRKMGQSYEHFDTIFQESVLPAVERAREQRMAKFDREADQVLITLESSLGKLVSALRQKADDATDNYRSSAFFSANLVIVAAGGIALVGLLVSFLLARAMAGPIRLALSQLGRSSDQVSSAAGEISTAGQSLAQSASQQAASLEETAASLEELTSSTSGNAERAAQADELMRQASQSVDQVAKTMQELTQAMAGITASNEESVKIIKTIDEIAFQTNLLALNAAVEAARAGEAGAGFAVVADEVRNLAMRAAEAARNTGNLIEQNMKEITAGSELVEATDHAFALVQDNSGQVADLIGKIAEAGAKQAEELGAINRTAGEMDVLTQKLAARAQESAATGEELNGLSHKLKDVVIKLDLVVQGSRSGDQAPGVAMVDEEPEAKPAKSSLIRRLLPGRSSAQDPPGEDLGGF